METINRDSYEAPTVVILEVKSEGIICQSIPLWNGEGD